MNVCGVGAATSATSLLATWRLASWQSSFDVASLSPLIERVGWTLVHFTWEGLLVAALLAIVLRAMRECSSAARYGMSCLAMALLMALPVVTFVFFVRGNSSTAWIDVEELRRRVALAGAETNLSDEVAATIDHAPPTDLHPQHYPLLPPLERLRSAFPWLVGGWAIGVALLALWHSVGWLRVCRLRRLNIRPLSEAWGTLFAEVAERVGVRRAVQLFESTRAAVPMVIGWLRPVILVPASAVSGLTVAQLEAILAHELAHVRRFDYLVNLIQVAAETVLFYHPAVWWVSGRIRTEREHCCDDLAAAATPGGAVAYARALARLEELRMPLPLPHDPLRLVPAATTGSLLNRVRRLLGHETPGDADRRDGNVTVIPRARPIGAAMLVAAAIAAGALAPFAGGLPGAIAADSTASADNAKATEVLPEQKAASNAATAAREESLKKLDELHTLVQRGDDPPGFEEQLERSNKVKFLQRELSEMESKLAEVVKQQGADQDAARYKREVEAKQRQLADVREELKAAVINALTSKYKEQVKAADDALAAAANATAKTPAAAESPGDRPLAAEDVIQVTVTDSSKPTPKMVMKSIARISPQGWIPLPHVGQIEAAGLTAARLEQNISKAYGPEGINFGPADRQVKVTYAPPGETPDADATGEATPGSADAVIQFTPAKLDAATASADLNTAKLDAATASVDLNTAKLDDLSAQLASQQAALADVTAKLSADNVRLQALGDVRINSETTATLEDVNNPLQAKINVLPDGAIRFNATRTADVVTSGEVLLEKVNEDAPKSVELQFDKIDSEAPQGVEINFDKVNVEAPQEAEIRFGKVNDDAPKGVELRFDKINVESPKEVEVRLEKLDGPKGLEVRLDKVDGRVASIEFTNKADRDADDDNDADDDDVRASPDKPAKNAKPDKPRKEKVKPDGKKGDPEKKSADKRDEPSADVNGKVPVLSEIPYVKRFFVRNADEQQQQVEQKQREAQTQALQARLNETEAQAAKLRQEVGPEDPKLKALQAEQEKLKEAMAHLSASTDRQKNAYRLKLAQPGTPPSAGKSPYEPQNRELKPYPTTPGAPYTIIKRAPTTTDVSIIEQRLKKLEELQKKGNASEAEVNEARAALDKARALAESRAAEARVAEEKLRRIEELYRNGNVSAAELDRAKAEMARAKAAQVANQWGIREDGKRFAEQEQKLAHLKQLEATGYASKAELEKAQAQLDQAKAELAKAKAEWEAQRRDNLDAAKIDGYRRNNVADGRDQADFERDLVRRKLEVLNEELARSEVDRAKAQAMAAQSANKESAEAQLKALEVQREQLRSAYEEQAKMAAEMERRRAKMQQDQQEMMKRMEAEHRDMAAKQAAIAREAEEAARRSQADARRAEAEAERNRAEALAKQAEDKARAQQDASGEYFISGVPNPGSRPVRTGGRQITLLQALVAGGFDPAKARGSEVIIVRQPSDPNSAVQRESIPVDEVIEGKQRPVQSGDVILIRPGGGGRDGDGRDGKRP